MAFFNNEIMNVSGVPCAEGYDAEFGGLSRIVEETAADMFDITRMMHGLDMQEIKTAYTLRSIREAAGDDSDDEIKNELDEFENTQEGAIGDLFSRIKDALKKFFSKVFGFFRSLYEKFIALKKSNKSFAEKYKSIVDEYSEYIPSFTYTGFNYDLAAMENQANKINDSSDGFESTIIKTIVDTISKFDAETAAEDIQKVKQLVDSAKDNLNKVSNTTVADTKANLRGDSTKSITYNATSVLSSLDVLEKIDMKAIKKYEASAKKSYADAESAIKRAEAEYKKLSDDVSNKSVLVSLANNAYSTTTLHKGATLRVLTAFRECCVDFGNQIKNVTLLAIQKGKEAKKKADSK